jgi:hypothetical protein
MSKFSTLLTVRKRTFNPKNPNDLEIAKEFFETKSWGKMGGCPFELEFPHLDVPSMMAKKIAETLFCDDVELSI